MNQIVLNKDERDFLIWREGMGRTVEIFDICVGSERRKGKGTRLVELLILELVKKDEAERPALIYAITRQSNAIAHQFYEAFGFHILGRLHYFYQDGGDNHEHAVMYGMEL